MLANRRRCCRVTSVPFVLSKTRTPKECRRRRRRFLISFFFFADKPHDKLFFAHLSRYPLICMSEFVQKKTSLDHTFKKRHDAFRSISRLFHHACGRARPPMRAPHVRSQGRQGWLGGELFAFQVIRKGENTCVMSSPPFPSSP